MKLRVVLDTNQVIGAGSRWLDSGIPAEDKNICRQILIRVAEAHQGLYSGKIIGEYLEKLVDRRHPPDRAVRLITYIAGAFEQVIITTDSAPVKPSDPDDEIFLLCAIDGNADYLVSNDHSLFNLKANYSQFLMGKSEELAQMLGA